ncbi:uncharacterized protein [Littorina saxatilis]|uniref:EF-hand domain-containing protein n=1 Tax=Littorina saxatilis TaxID=31220 RepID=A0AAN9ANV5_9CAEN
MRMGLCLALLVCTVLVIESDALWSRRSRCRRRDLNEDPQADSAQDDVRCAHMVDHDDVTNVGVPFDMVKVVFKMLDGDDGDDVLNEREYLLFMDAMGEFKHCFPNETTSA